jgi:hypothetical protein
MCKTAVLMVLCSGLFLRSFSDVNHSGGIPMFASPLKVYIDSTTKSVYWPVDLPFYVKLSTAPEKDAPTFLLNQLLDGQGKNGSEKGITLNTSGKQFVRWLNYQTGKETLLRFFADGEPPVVSDSFFGAPVYYTKVDTFYGGGLKYAVYAKDAFSGVDSIKSSTDISEFNPYEKPIELDTEKEYKISSYAVDKVGYASSLKTRRCIVDRTPPISTHETQTNFFDDVLSVMSTIKLHSTDKHSGLKSMFFKFDNQTQFLPYTGQTFTLGSFNDGNHVLSFYGVDNVKNVESQVDYNFYIDRTPPVPQISIEGDNYVSDKSTFISTRSLVSLSATDNRIGVQKIQYIVNANTKIETYENAFPITLSGGPLNVTYFATDKLGNASQKSSKIFIMDPTAPKTDFKVTGPHYQQHTAIWVTKETALEFFSTDKGSGVKRIEYQIGSGNIETYSAPFSIPDEGKYPLRHRGIDNVNNIEDDNVFLIIVDNSNPVIKAIFSVPPADSLVNKDGASVYAYAQYTSLFLAATDQAAGIKTVWYSLNNGPEQEYHNVILCDKTGDHTIKIRAQDNVGHTTEETISFYIKAIEATK